MKIFYIPIFAGIILFYLLAVLSKPHGHEQTPPVAPSDDFRVLVKFSSECLEPVRYELSVDHITSEPVRNVLTDFGVISTRAVFRNRYDENGMLKTSLAPSNNYYLEGWRQVIIDDRDMARNFVRIIAGYEGIERAFIETPVIIQPAIAPNDSQYAGQWHLNDPVFPNADIRAEAAWDINKGRNDVIIAILDGGVDYTHPDLDPGDRSRVIAGYDTGDGDNDPMDNLPDNDPDSYAGHGTSVAGVAGAITNNEQQVAGVMWHCRIMPVKMVRSGGIRIPHILNWDWSTTAFPSDVADAIDYAVNNGAHVINLSYSFPSMGWLLNEVIFRIPLLHQALDNAYHNNVVITASMGNHFETDNSTRYPAGFREQVIAVGATARQRTKAGFSNTGPHISVSAPGAGILTTERGGGTRVVSGTSFSAPIAAGVAGLIISQGKDRGFNLTNDDVRHILELTAEDVPEYGTGFDEETGHGIVNAYNALYLLDEPNELYHGVSYGGSTTKTNISQWIYIGSRWGIAAGTYLDVDRYMVTKRVNFEIPFCSPPTVWMRERHSVCISGASPNNGLPWSQITNVTETGFDVTYFTYYVRKNAAEQTLNKWVPAEINSSGIAYTAVGKPNMAAAAGPVTGPSIVCNTNTTFSLNNLSPNLFVTWTKSDNLTYVSGQDSANYTVKATGPATSGEGWVEASITGECGTLVLRKDVWVGIPKKPSHIVFVPHTPCTNQFVLAYFNEINPPISQVYYQWSGGDHVFFPQGESSTWFQTKGPLSYTTNVHVSAQNICGNNILTQLLTVQECGGGGIPPVPPASDPETPLLAISPNPASDYIDVSINNFSQQLQGNEVYVMTIYDRFSQAVRNVTTDVPHVRIPVYNLPTGTYVLSVVSGDQVRLHGKFIIQR